MARRRDRHRRARLVPRGRSLIARRLRALRSAALRAPRPLASWLLLVLGALLLVAAQLTLWTSDAVLDSDGFTDRAVRALSDERVQAYVSAFIVDQLIERGSSQLVAARPLIEAAVQAVIGSAAFEQLYDTALRQTHRALLGDEPIVLRIVDASVVVQNTLSSFNADLAESLPEIDTSVLEVADSVYVDGVLRVANAVRFLAVALPLAALAAFAGSWAVARGRRGALMRVGVAALAVALLMVLALDVSRAVLAAVVGGGRAGEATTGAWNAFLGDLRGWNVAIGAAGAVLATAASPWMAGRSPLQALRRLGSVGLAPGDGPWQLARPLALVAVGAAALLNPRGFADLAIAVAGVAAIYFGLAELARLLRRPGLPSAADATSAAGGAARAAAEAAAARRPGPRGATRAAAVAALLLAGAVLAWTQLSGLLPFGGGAEARPAVCNGHAALCDRRVDEVAFAATHNSMSSAADGWYLAAHRDGIAAQLEAGVRALLIDVWYGSPTRAGVATEYLGGDREAMDERYGEDVMAARDRVAEALDAGAARALYLCHVFCELGATPLADALADVRRFLVSNPGEVVIVVVQDEAPAADVAAAFADAGLDRYAYAHPGPADPWPTLGELSERNERLIVMTENAASAPEPWMHRGFELMQETPYSFRSDDELSCEPNRGPASAPLFLVNHWIEDVSPLIGDAERLNARGFLLPRLRQCETERGLLPNLVAVNFYRSGDLLAVVDELNGVAAAPAE